MLTTIGSAETMTLKAPHRHLAVLGIFVVSSEDDANLRAVKKATVWPPAMDRSSRRCIDGPMRIRVNLANLIAIAL